MDAIRRFCATARKPLTVVHIIGSVGLMGATASSLMLAVVAGTTSDDDLAHSAYRLIGIGSGVFGIPLSFVALLSGIALGLGTKWGVLRYRWTAGKLILVVGVILNGALAIGPTTAARIDGGGSSLLLQVAAAATVAMLALSVALTVYKPGGRRPTRASHSRGKPAVEVPGVPTAALADQGGVLKPAAGRRAPVGSSRPGRSAVTRPPTRTRRDR